MAVPAKTRDKIRKEMVDWLLDGGNNVESFRAKYPEVPHSTFYRWLKGARAEVGRRLAMQTIESADQLRKAAADVLPVPVSLNSLTPVCDANPLQITQIVIQMALDEVEHCKLNGKIRNLRGHNQAARLLLAAIDTQCRVAALINDVQMVEQFHKAIYDVLLEETPERAKNVVQHIRTVQDNFFAGRGVQYKD